MNDFRQMYNLQKVDTAWLEVKRGLLHIQSQLGESQELKKARQKIVDTEAELQKWQTQHRDSELEAQSLSERIEQNDKVLMSGENSNPKELEALQSNLESLKTQRTKIEDESVEAMMKSEELTKTLSKYQESATEMEESWKSGQGELITAGKKLKQQYLTLQKKREEIAATLPDALLKQYEQLRKRKAGVAVAVLKEDTCSACHMQVPRGVISSVQAHGTGINLCTSCGRILVTEQA